MREDQSDWHVGLAASGYPDESLGGLAYIHMTAKLTLASTPTTAARVCECYVCDCQLASC